MVPVQSILVMVLAVLYSISHVSIGLMMMELKIIHFTVNRSYRLNYSLNEFRLGWANDRSKSMMISFSFFSTFQARLPVGNDQTSLLHLIIRIRDRLECITEFDLTSVYVRPDSAGMNDLMNNLQSSSTTNNPIVQLLASGNQNTVGQVISSISQQFNQKNTENMNNAISSNHFIWIFI